MLKTFRRGVHPSSRKDTKDVVLTEFSTPDVVYICLSQHIGQPSEPVVKSGDGVKVGTLIAKQSGFVSSNIYSSVSGKVRGIEKRETAQGIKVNHVVIENDGRYDEEFLEKLENPTKEEILARITEAGIVGMGGATFPTQVKYSPKSSVDTLIINGAECEPFITCDYRLMLEKADEFIEGVRLIKKVLGVDKAYIGIENNKKPAIDLLLSKKLEDIQIVPLKVKYPQGAEKQLIYAVTSRKVPAGGLPMDVGCVVSNVHTAYSIYEAVKLGKPLYMRALTVSGNGVEHKGNYWVRNGVTAEYIFEQTRGNANGEIKKVISGGPMMGFALDSLDVATTKGSSSLLFLTESEINLAPTTACINCATCASVCPMNLMPMFIEKATQHGEFDMASKYSVMNCIECGSCAYSCPAKRPLVQAIKLAKKEIRKRGIK